MESLTDVTELNFVLEHYKLKEECDKQVSDSHLKEIYCDKWEKLDTHLELGSHVVSDINCNHKKEEDKRSAFFSAWKQKKGCDATYRKLIHAFLKIECRNDAEAVCMLLQKSVSVQTNSSASLKRQPVSHAGIAYSYS